jgi:hypothetical protein
MLPVSGIPASAAAAKMRSGRLGEAHNTSGNNGDRGISPARCGEARS